MVLLICLLIFIWAIFKIADDDVESARDDYNYEVSERRHQELMDIQKRNQELLEEERAELEAYEKKKNKSKTVRRIRTIIEDEDGNIIAQEVIEQESEE